MKRYIVIILLVALALGLAFASGIKPAQDISETLYKNDVASWTKRLKEDNKVLATVFNADADKARIQFAYTDVIDLQKEIHASKAPAQFNDFHTHFSLAIDHYVNAFNALHNGKLSLAVAELNIASIQFKQADDLLKRIT